MTSELKELLAKAQAKYDAMAPEERVDMWAAQRRSYVRGELMMSYPDMTYEEADRRAREAESYCLAASDAK